MLKLRLYLSSGAILTSTPMGSHEVNDFLEPFKGMEDVVEIERISMPRGDAQEEFRNGAILWRRLADRNRLDPQKYDPEKDRVAATAYHAFMKVGHSG